jgi:hypothetical protein
MYSFNPTKRFGAAQVVKMVNRRSLLCQRDQTVSMRLRSRSILVFEHFMNRMNIPSRIRDHGQYMDGNG